MGQPLLLSVSPSFVPSITLHHTKIRITNSSKAKKKKTLEIHFVTVICTITVLCDRTVLQLQCASHCMFIVRIIGYARYKMFEGFRVNLTKTVITSCMTC